MTPFEQKLAATPRREPPPEWRAEILQGARASRPQTNTIAGGLWGDGDPASPSAALPVFLRRAQALFAFPHPGWCALAAAWIVITILNLSGPRGEELYAVTPKEYRGRLPSTQEYLAHAEWQQHLLLSLAGEPGISIENRYFPLPRNL